MSDFQGLIGGYRIIKTDDNSLTLYSEAFDEACHSSSGAWLETLYNYVEGCEIERYRDESLAIFEVGLGLGFGYAATVEKLGGDFKGNLTFVSTEIDSGLITWCCQHTNLSEPVKKVFPNFEELVEVRDGELTTMQAEKNGNKLIVLIGNARDTVPAAHARGLIPPIQAIYQDPFSPKRNPTLWTVEWFEILRSLSLGQVILSTYSASSSIRKAMLEAGWKLENRKGFGPKRAATRAFLTGPTAQELLESLSRSPAKALRD